MAADISWNESTEPDERGRCYLTATCVKTGLWMVVRVECDEPHEDGGAAGYVEAVDLPSLEAAEEVAARLARAVH